uniref:Phycocyanin-645 alpha-2 chain n=1 Tax=Chroomonas sp. TaxID=3029 RepID=PHEA2_CHRSP|nr:RecName: Full=Phycocyanin-645 alpha-2 chain; Short=PC-645 [Chroomonas sp.]
KNGDLRTPVITIFDARGCKDHANKEYTGPKAGGADDEMCVKVAMQKIAVAEDAAALVLKECLSELKARKK